MVLLDHGAWCRCGASLEADSQAEMSEQGVCWGNTAGEGASREGGGKVELGRSCGRCLEPGGPTEPPGMDQGLNDPGLGCSH